MVSEKSRPVNPHTNALAWGYIIKNFFNNNMPDKQKFLDKKMPERSSVFPQALVVP